MYLKVLSHTGCCEAYFCCFAGYCLLLSVLHRATLSFMCCISSTTQISYPRTCPVMSVNCQCSASIKLSRRGVSSATKRQEQSMMLHEVSIISRSVLLFFVFVAMSTSHRGSCVCIALEEMENHSEISL